MMARVVGPVTSHVHPTAIIDPSAQHRRGGRDRSVGDRRASRSRSATAVASVRAPRLERNVHPGRGRERRRRVDPRRRPAGPQVQGRGDLGRDRRGHDHPGVHHDQPRHLAELPAPTVGARCFIMTYVHLAHDCHVGDEVIIANGTQFAGHVTIHDRAVLSGLNAVHQFVTIGTYAFVGGGSRVNQDIPPYVKAVGNPMELYGLNSIGLQRAGFSGRHRRRAQARVPTVLQLRAQSLAGARAGPERSADVRPRWSSSSPSSNRPSGACPRERAAPDRRRRRRRARPPPRAPPGAARRARRLVGVFDIDGERGRGGRRRSSGPRPFTDLDALLDEVEAVTVAVPTPAHHDGRRRRRSSGASRC